MDKHLLTFMKVADKKSFSRAAEELFLTQSAVSKEIETLEIEYGVKLLSRTNKSVSLTPAGEILYYHGQKIMNEYLKASKVIDDLLNSVSGNISIGSGFIFGEYLLPHIVAKFKHTFPQITPKITIMNSSRIALEVLNGNVDLGIVDREMNLKDIITYPFVQDEMVLIVPKGHKLSLMEELSASELESETWILREPGSGTRAVTDNVFRDLGLRPSSLMEFGSTQIIKESVQAGLGISIMPKFVIKRDAHLNMLQIKDYKIYWNCFSVVHASQFETKASTSFLELLYQLTPYLMKHGVTSF